ncbi:het-domain-containing protein [Venturia nashicola]|uniref:Het-domain-containing protein n=1 Tax=Venturia nashicola TaxID=86259 RepID=A0A4Z1P3I0_9PEZI|nr:het-domain-containing protein [Venturia nashicola]
MCQALDVQYLWIDSLCIIQDDQGDWGAHVKLMAEIYRDAFITLAVGASENDDGGFFRQLEEMFTKLHFFTIVEDGDEYPISDLNNLSQLSRQHMLSLWRDLVMHYTERFLTCPSDKTPALAGLAAHFEAAGAGNHLHRHRCDRLHAVCLEHNGYFPLLVKGTLARLCLVSEDSNSNMLEAYPGYRDVKGQLATPMVRDTISPQIPSSIGTEQGHIGCL